MEVLHSGTFIADQEASAAVTCHLVLHGGRMVIAGLANGSIAVWRCRSHESAGYVEAKPQMLHGHTGLVNGLLLANEAGIGGQGGYLLMSWSADRTVRIWDPEVKEADKVCVQTLRSHGGTVTDAVYANGTLITGSTDKSIRVWRAEDGRELMLYPWFSPTQVLHDVDGWVNALALHTADGCALYVGDEQGTLCAYRTTHTRGGGMQLSRWRRQPNAHALGIIRLLVVQSEHTLVSASYDCTVKLFDTASGTVLLSIENVHKVRYTALWFDVDRAQLLLGDELGHVQFWATSSSETCLKSERLWGPGSVRKQGVAKVAAVLAAAAKTKPSTSGPASAGAAAEGGGGTSGAAARGLRQLSLEGGSGGFLFSSSGTAVDAWTVLRDVKYAETAGHTGPVIALAAVEPAGATTLGPGESLPQIAVPSSEQRVLYSASLDGTVRAWDLHDMACLSVLQETRSEICCIHFSQLCDMLITGHDDGSVRIWNVDSGSTLTLPGHSNSVTCLAVAPKGSSQLLLSSGFDGQVGVWDVTKRQNALPRLELLFRAHEEEVLAMLVVTHSPTYVTAGNAGSVRVWSLKSHERLATLRGHSDTVCALALDGNFLLSGSEDGSVRLWDMCSYSALGVFQVHQAPVCGLLVVPETGWIVTCSTDRTLRVWDYGAARELKVWSHSEQFRCVALRRSTNQLVVGTEEHHLVSFPLSEVLDEIDRASGEAAGAGAEEAASG